uniref:Uncharacterized protein n=1 Tax=Strongyloides papillosus TaxID=174720 RepID=A0A0N5BZN5_STREA
MKIIYLILTFAILYINAVEGEKNPRYVITGGVCSKQSCIFTCEVYVHVLLPGNCDQVNIFYCDYIIL